MNIVTDIPKTEDSLLRSFYEALYEYLIREAVLSSRPALVTSDTSLKLSDYYVGVDTENTVTIMLPPLANIVLGRQFIVKDETGGANINNITVAVFGTDQIQGTGSDILSIAYQTQIYVKGATQWQKLL